MHRRHWLKAIASLTSLLPVDPGTVNLVRSIPFNGTHDFILAGKAMMGSLFTTERA